MEYTKQCEHAKDGIRLVRIVRVSMLFMILSASGVMFVCSIGAGTPLGVLGFALAGVALARTYTVLKR